jgi:hypothetical protein
MNESTCTRCSSAVLYNKHYEEKEDDFPYRTICWPPRPKQHQILCQNEGKDLVPVQGVIVGKGKGGVGHQVVTVCVSHISAFVKQALVASDI